MTATKLYSAEDLWNLPDDGVHDYELYRGELYCMSPANTHSSAVAAGIAAHIIVWVRPRRWGLVTGADGGYIFERGPDTVFAPDVAFTRRDRLPSREARRKGFTEVVPDLVVEVISPSDRPRLVTEKVMTYLERGVRIVWVVDPFRRRIMVYVATPGEAEHYTMTILRDDDTLDGSDVLPGFTLPVSVVFDPEGTDDDAEAGADA